MPEGVVIRNTHNMEAPRPGCTRSSGFFCENVHGQETSESQPSSGEIQEVHVHQNINCLHDKTKIM